MDMFKEVAALNEAFGNPKGDYFNIDHKRITNAINGVRSELEKELVPAFEDFKQAKLVMAKVDMRDALCDIIVFALGGLHAMGVDGNADMRSVLDALRSRLCADQDQLDATIAKYAAMGIDVYAEGTFPTVCVKSARDQEMPEYPQGKFLKAAGYHKPTFEVPLG